MFVRVKDSVTGHIYSIPEGTEVEGQEVQGDEPTERAQPVQYKVPLGQKTRRNQSPTETQE